MDLDLCKWAIESSKKFILPFELDNKYRVTQH